MNEPFGITIVKLDPTPTAVAVTVFNSSTGRAVAPYQVVTAAEIDAAADTIAALMPGTLSLHVAEEIRRHFPAELPERPISAIELIQRYPIMKEAVIGGLLRRGETGNLIAGSKMHKSFTMMGLAICKALGFSFLGRFDMQPGRVLIVDNELTPETMSDRLKSVARGMGVEVAEFGDAINFHSLRGRLRDINQLRPFFATIKPREYDLIILDALYRMMPDSPGGENDNAAMTSVYNTLDDYASRLDCAFFIVHHSSKGIQGDKRTTDVGAGAGSQSRAVDAHCVLREHEDDGCAVFDGVVRSFPPPSAVGLRWNYPLWHEDPFLDTTKLKRERGAGGRPPKGSTSVGDGNDPEVEWTPESFTARFISATPTNSEKIISVAVQKITGMEKLSYRRARDLITIAVKDGFAFQHRNGNRTLYCNQPEQTFDSCVETSGA